MNARKYLSWTLRLHEKITGRFACRLYLGLFGLFLILTTVARVRCLLLTTRVQVVLHGLEQVRLDETTEEQLLKTIPYLVRGPHDEHTQMGVERTYWVTISNQDEWIWLMHQISVLIQNQELATNVSSWMGYRYFAFGARVAVVNGRVSSIRYGIKNELIYPWLAGNIIAVKSVHGFWKPRRSPVSIGSEDDESPQYRINGTARSLWITYTFDAPPELVSHVFQVKLSCFWSLYRCSSASEIAPVAWRDKRSIETATAARLMSPNPCPDSVLAGRMRYLPDLNVELLEVVNSRRQDVSKSGTDGEEFILDYRVKEVLRGRSVDPWIGIRFSPQLRPRQAGQGETANQGSPLSEIGDKVLGFTGVYFESCRMVRATPSAESLVRTILPAPARLEDEPLGVQ